MPKQSRAPAQIRRSPASTARIQYPMPSAAQPNHRTAAIWSTGDDEILLAARAGGLNWQPIALQHFPNKTANACRKRHERLMERRKHEEWDARKLSSLASAYMDCRKEMWSMLATKIGEPWGLVEAKCMEKGFRNMQAIARVVPKDAASSDHNHGRGNEEDDEGDSGICCSDAEMEPVTPTATLTIPLTLSLPLTLTLTLTTTTTTNAVRTALPAAIATAAMPSPNTAQARGHAGHSHSHHHHDNTYLTSANKNDPGVRITRVGLYVNLGMAIAKGAGGYAFNSQALTADAIHSLTDLISDFTTLATISYSLRSPTPRFPTGYGKIESLGALGVSGILLSGGLMIGLQAVMALAQQFFPAIADVLSHIGLFGHGHSHSHGADDLGPNINAAWLAAGSIVIKEWLYRATMKIATEKRSSVLASNAYHHRVDSLTAIVALCTIIASHFIPNAQWLDPVGGLIISGMIVQAGYGNTKNALLELADVGVDEDIRLGVEQAAAEALSASKVPSEKAPVVQGIKSGQNYLMEIAVSVPGSLTLDELKQVEQSVRETVAARVKGVKRVTIRFVDARSEGDAFADEFVASTEGEEHSHDHDHDHAHDHAHGHSNDHDSGSTVGSVNKRK
ncbi:hypothetical protein MBLNU459_g0399t1 [Dothideomycetes sp. NU459]